MVKGKDKKPKSNNGISEQTLDEAFVQGKIVLLKAFLEEHSIALVPTLHSDMNGIVPKVNVVKYDPKATK